MGRRRRGSQASETIPDELRCKRSDGKSWRCGERAAEGKSMCEKHFKQAKKRAAASAARQSAKRQKGERAKNKLLKETAKGAARKKHKRLASSDTELESDDGTDASSDSPSFSPVNKHNSDDNESFLPLKRPRGASSSQSDPSSKKIDDSSNKVRKSVIAEHGERVGKKSKLDDDADDSQGKNRKAADVSERKAKENIENFKKKVRKDVDSLEKKTKHHTKLIEKVDDSERKVRFKDEPEEKVSERNIKANKEEYGRKIKQTRQNQEMGEMSQDFSITDELRIKGQPAASATNAKDSHREFNAVEKNSASSEKPGKKNDRNKCHHCQGTNKETIHCQKCKSKQYCSTCIRRWYPERTEDDVSESCPACLGNCNCKVCLHARVRSTAEERTKPSDAERISTFRYILSFLLPLLKSLDKQQKDEIELEVKLKGISEAEIKRTRLNSDERILCDNCNRSIVDLHRSCPDCNYDLCLLCSQELREGKLLSNQHVDPLEKVNNDCMAVQDSEFQIWKANEDGSIPCPPKENGGCGSHELNLVCIAKHGWIKKLVIDVEAAVEGERSVQKKLFEPCNFHSVEGQSVSSSDHRRCVYQAVDKSTPGNNFMFCPSASNIDKNTLKHFQKHWLQGEPVIVRDVLHNGKGLTWEPMVFLKAFQEKIDNAFAEGKEIVKGLNCLDWCEVDINIQQFFKGFQDGYVCKDDLPVLFKLKDWPPTNFFCECLLSHCTEFISVLPFHDYTHPTRGLLNLVTKIPNNVRKPNIGPKTHIGYGVQKELGRGDSVMKLHCDIFDVVNVLTHCTEAKVLDWQRGRLRKRNEENESDFHIESSEPDLNGIKLQRQNKPRANDTSVEEQGNSEATVPSDGVSEANDSRLIQAADENNESVAIIFSENVHAQASGAVDRDHKGDPDIFVNDGNVEQSTLTKDVNESINNATIVVVGKSSLETASQNDTMTSIQHESINNVAIMIEGKSSVEVASRNDTMTSVQGVTEIKIPEKVEHTETQQCESIDDNPQKYLHDQIEDMGYSEPLSPSFQNNGTIDGVPSDVQVNSLDISQQKTFLAEINIENGSKDVSTDVSEHADHNASDIIVGNKEIRPLSNTLLKDSVQDMLNAGHVTHMNEQEGKSICSSEKEGDDYGKFQAMSRDHECDLAKNHINPVEQTNLMDTNAQMIEIDVKNTQLMKEGNNNISEIKEEKHHVVLESHTLEIPVPVTVQLDHVDECEDSAFDQRECCLKAESEDLNPVKCVQKDEIPDNETKLGSAGAIWDVFDREDVPKLQMYLEKHWREFQCTEKFHTHAMLDQSIFLTQEHKRRLKEEYGVEAWTFEQNSGEAVFIPAGCPHQVRNMKSCISVALEFVSPETVQESVRLSEQYRQLPKGHHAKEDELEVNRMVIFAAAAAVKQLNYLLKPETA